MLSSQESEKIAEQFFFFKSAELGGGTNVGFM